GDFARIWLLVNAPLAARLPFEVLDGIGDIGLGTVDAGIVEGAVEQLARRPDEWPSGDVFGVARLLADEEQRRSDVAFAEDGLRAALPQLAGAAARRCLAQRIQIGVWWNKRAGRKHGVHHPAILL